MTIRLSSAIHPTFEALSAHADAPLPEGTRSRVGRHVVQCADCRAIVAEIHGYGAAIRAVPEAEAPRDLWSRIEHAPRVGDEEVRTVKVPAARHDMRRWVGAAVLAAAAAVAGVVLWPGERSLEATDVSRLTFSPGRPAPGSVLTVRYRAAEWLRGQPKLILVGRYNFSADSSELYWKSRDGGLGDSIAVLRPTANGMYEARFRLPAAFQSLQVQVSDSAAKEYDMDGRFMWGLIAGDASGGPSLTALISTISRAEDFGAGAPAPQRSFADKVSDSLIKYFPDHPAGWAYRRDGASGRQRNFLGLFSSSERKFRSLNERLGAQPVVDAEQEHDMAIFAWQLEEPAIAADWARRLAREHPEHPKALMDYARMLHEFELADSATAGDSIRPWLTVLDTLFHRQTHAYQNDESWASLLVRRYGDASLKARWDTGPRAVRFRPLRFTPDSELTSITTAEEKYEIDASNSICSRAPGKFPIGGGVSEILQRCLRTRGAAYEQRGRLALSRGESRRALQLTDSALAIMPSFVRCYSQVGWLVRARAELALGNRDRAQSALAVSLSSSSIHDATREARKMFGAFMDSAAFVARMDSVARARRACDAQAQVDASAQRRLEHQRSSP